MKKYTCILALTIWVMLLVLGYCWHLELEIPRVSNIGEINSKPLTLVINAESPHKNYSVTFNSLVAVKQPFQDLCNFPDNIQTEEEGKPIKNAKLRGLVIVIRHGDRGPLSSIRNLEAIKCTYSSTLISEYSRFMRHFSSSKEYSEVAGSLANFAVLPNRKKCDIGQLTYQGLAQLLHLGQTLRLAYKDFLESIPATSITLVSTPYARTLQSLWALVYSFWDANSAYIKQLKVRSGSNVQFCGHFCNCLRAESLEKQFKQEWYSYTHLNISVLRKLAEIGQVALPGRPASDQCNAHVLKDVMLTYVCHSSPFPCDQHSCVTQAHLQALASYFEAERLFYLRNTALQSASYLRGYGFLRTMVSQVVDMVTNKGARVIIYSAHDKTLFTLLHALGLSDGSLPKYASRFVLELWESESLSQKYFVRFVFNGENVSHRFCQSKFDPDVMCELEVFQQYVDTLLMEKFNAQSFKEGCAL